MLSGNINAHPHNKMAAVNLNLAEELHFIIVFWIAVHK